MLYKLLFLSFVPLKSTPNYVYIYFRQSIQDCYNRTNGFGLMDRWFWTNFDLKCA